MERVIIWRLQEARAWEVGTLLERIPLAQYWGEIRHSGSWHEWKVEAKSKSPLSRMSTLRWRKVMGSIRGLEGLSEARAGEKARRKLKASKVGEEVTSSASDFGVRGRNGHLGRGECRRKERDWQGEFPPVASLLQSIGGKRMEGRNPHPSFLTFWTFFLPRNRTSYHLYSALHSL